MAQAHNTLGSTIGRALGNAAAYAVSTIFVLRTLGLEPAVYGLIGSASAAGGLLAALFAERITRVIGEGRAIPWSAVAMGAAFALTPLAALNLLASLRARLEGLE